MIRLAALALLIIITTNSAHADAIQNLSRDDCDKIRNLTALERWILIGRLKLSAADIRAIKKRCNIK